MQGSAAPRITLNRISDSEGKAMMPGRRADVRPTYFLLVGPVGLAGRGFGMRRSFRSILSSSESSGRGRKTLRRFHIAACLLALWANACQANACVVLPRSQDFGSQPFTTPEEWFCSTELDREGSGENARLELEFSLLRRSRRTDRFISPGSGPEAGLLLLRSSSIL